MRGRRRKAIRFIDRSNEVPVPDSLACSLQGTSLYTFGGLNCPFWEGYCRNDPGVTFVPMGSKRMIELLASLVYCNPET